MSEKHPLLIDDSRTMVFQPELAKLIGLNEAIVLQQIHYWINNSREADRNFYDGMYWVYNTYEGWQEQFTFWSVNTIIRILKNLEDKGFLITGNYNKKGYDKTKWYSINYNNLEKTRNIAIDVENAHVLKMGSPATQNEQSMYPIWVDGCTQNEQTNTIEYTYNSSKSSSKSSSSMVRNSNEISNDVDESFDFKILNSQIKISYMMLINENGSLPYDVDDYIEVFTYFYQSYEEYTGETHPKIRSEHIKKVMEDLPYVQGGNADGEDVDTGANRDMIDAYFKQPWDKDINPTILHYMSGDIRLNRWYETNY